MVDRFHGLVKVEDVERAFKELVDRVNELQNSINIVNDSENIDYTVGSKTLAPSGYTLSVGGLKLLLEAYDGVVIGCKIFKVDENKSTKAVTYAISEGILITKNGGVRLPSATISGSLNDTAIFFDKRTETYSTMPEFDSIKISDINPNRNDISVRDIAKTQVEDIYGKYKIMTESRTFGNVANGGAMTVDTSEKAKFVSAIDSVRLQNQGTSTVKLFGQTVASNSQTGSRNLNYWVNVNFLYVPKNCSNPYTVSNGNSTKVFDVIEELEVRND